MKKSILMTLAVTLALPFAAQAEFTTLSCVSKDQTLKIKVTTDFVGSFDDVAEKGEIKAVGMIENLKPGIPPMLEGTVSESAKGPYFELKGEGLTLFVSAAASKSPSTLTMNGPSTDLDCNTLQ